MIIAAYAAAGKSTFAAQMENAVELPCMPYKWILPPANRTPAEIEAEKGALYHLYSPLYPDNYLLEILTAERNHRFVIIPTDMEVIRRLQEDYGRKVLLCCPSDDCREEYRERFIARGNSESFLSLFADGWERFLGPVRENKRGVHIDMGVGEYLSDLRPRIEEEFRSDQTAPVMDDAIRDLERRLAERQKDLVLYLSADDGCCFYSIPNLDAPEEREFLCRTGRRILEAGDAIDIVPVIAPRDFFRKESIDAFCTGDRESVEEFIAKHHQWSLNRGKTYDKCDS